MGRLHEALDRYERVRAEHHGRDCRAVWAREEREMRTAILSSAEALSAALSFCDENGTTWAPVINVYVPLGGRGHDHDESYRVCMPTTAEILGTAADYRETISI